LDSHGGNGGYGATGGSGGNAGGGGGGSGYTDGSVTVVTTTLGGSTGNARVDFKTSWLHKYLKFNGWRVKPMAVNKNFAIKNGLRGQY
jgi:hypothetical protein